MSPASEEKRSRGQIFAAAGGATNQLGGFKRRAVKGMMQQRGNGPVYRAFGCNKEVYEEVHRELRPQGHSGGGEI